MRRGSTNNGMGVCVCECVFEGFCYEGLPCRGSDGWGWVSEAFSINLPLSLQGAPIRLCSFTCSLSLSHTQMHTHTVTQARIVIACCSFHAHFSSPIRTHKAKNSAKHMDFMSHTSTDCNYTPPCLHTHCSPTQGYCQLYHNSMPICACTTQTLLPYTSLSSLHPPGWVKRLSSLSAMLSPLTLLPLVASLALAQQVDLHSDN